jgi:hypothetical protein
MKRSTGIAALLLSACAAWAQTTPAEYEGVLKTLGKQGDYKSNVLRVNIPRNDLKISIDGVAANAVWVWRLGRHDQGFWRSRRHDGRSRPVGR